METSRRSVLKAGLASTAAVAGLTPALTTPTTAAATPVRQNPFTLGVASGDPDHDGFVLWTRLAPTRWPRTASAACRAARTPSSGRSPPTSGSATWCAAASPSPGRSTAHTVHVERARAAARPRVLLPVPRRGPRLADRPDPHRPAPAVRTPRALAMSFVSCSQYEHGYFTAYRRLAEDHPELILHLGDYQYEYTKGALQRPGRQRPRPRGPGDRDAGQLPAAARPVQDRPRPAGRARGRALAGGLRRPRGREQLGRRGARSSPRHRLPRPPRGRVPGVLREHAAAPHLDPARHRHAALPAGALGPAGHLPHARHPAVPRRPGLRRRLQGLPGRGRPGPLDHRRASRRSGCSTASAARRPAGTSSASRSSSPSATTTRARRR